MIEKTLKTLSGAIMVIAAWLIISPFFFVFSNTSYWNSIIAGGVLLILAGIIEWSEAGQNTWASWINALSGLWLVGSAFVIGDTGVAYWSALAGGVVVAVLAGWSLSITTLPAEPTPSMKI